MTSQILSLLIFYFLFLYLCVMKQNQQTQPDKSVAIYCWLAFNCKYKQFSVELCWLVPLNCKNNISFHRLLGQLYKKLSNVEYSKMLMLVRAHSWCIAARLWAGHFCVLTYLPKSVWFWFFFIGINKEEEKTQMTPHKEYCKQNFQVKICFSIILAWGHKNFKIIPL